MQVLSCISFFSWIDCTVANTEPIFSSLVFEASKHSLQMLFQHLPDLEVSLILNTLMLLAVSVPPYLFYNLFLAGKIPEGLAWAGSEGKAVFWPFRLVAAALRDVPAPLWSALGSMHELVVCSCLEI